jgi:2-polyprenyl-3-methyl-5-hydroxy-6-metoxy-1,4-benzoquinol methylase
MQSQALLSDMQIRLRASNSTVAEYSQRMDKYKNDFDLINEKLTRIALGDGELADRLQKLTASNSKQAEVMVTLVELAEKLHGEMHEIKTICYDHLKLGHIAEERSRTLEHISSKVSDALAENTQFSVDAAEKTLNLAQSMEARIISLENTYTIGLDHVDAERGQTAKILEQNLSIKIGIDERLASLESGSLRVMEAIDAHGRSFEGIGEKQLELTKIIEERSRTLQYIGEQNGDALRYKIELDHKNFVQQVRDSAARGAKPLPDASPIVILTTQSPLAVSSNDYINPESTLEGDVRPTNFVLDCINILGSQMSCLDLGVGAGGLVYEFVVNDVFAVGLDGSDFCKRYRVGYWPLLVNNLFNCDLTESFQLTSCINSDVFRFDLITMWEVLEHIDEADLAALFKNVVEHLDAEGYFVGSISLLEYVDKSGHPYHVTLRPKAWWADVFSQNGLAMCDYHPFNTNFFCRGVGRNYHDHHNYEMNPAAGFHFVARHLSSAKSA